MMLSLNMWFSLTMAIMIKVKFCIVLFGRPRSPGPGLAAIAPKARAFLQNWSLLTYMIAYIQQTCRVGIIALGHCIFIVNKRPHLNRNSRFAWIHTLKQVVRHVLLLSSWFDSYYCFFSRSLRFDCYYYVWSGAKKRTVGCDHNQ